MIKIGHRTEPLTEIVARLAAVYRALPESRLLANLPDGTDRAHAGHGLAARLALAAQGVEERDREVPPHWRELPYVGHFIVGDQIAVTGHDLIAAVAKLANAGEQVWAADPDGSGRSGGSGGSGRSGSSVAPGKPGGPAGLAGPAGSALRVPADELVAELTKAANRLKAAL